jgi:hypothetical protein
MTTHDTRPGGGSADEARHRLESAADKVKGDAAAAGEDAMKRAESEAERQKEMGAGHLDVFAEAVRKAADELGERDESAAAQFVREAAGGLESLSGSLREKSVGDLVDSVSRFGRSNPTAFLGGALLAGVALGRFAQASGQRAHGSRNGGYRSGATSAEDHGMSPSRPSDAASSRSATPSSPGGHATASPGSASGHSAAARPFQSSVTTGGSTDAPR